MLPGHKDVGRQAPLVVPPGHALLLPSALCILCDAKPRLIILSVSISMAHPLGLFFPFPALTEGYRLVIGPAGGKHSDNTLQLWSCQ